MELTNFKIASSVELEGLGHWWDLHSCVSFVGLELLLSDCGARLRWEVMESRKRLIAACTEEQKASDLIAHYPEDATILQHWRTVRDEVRRAAEHYAIALDNYLEGVLSELACCRRAVLKRPPLSLARSTLRRPHPGRHFHHRRWGT